MTEGADGRSRATIVTIAKAAGVSASTVSRALKGDPRITAPTRRRVTRVAAELGYRPNAFARTLQTGRSGLVGLVLGPLENPFYGHLLQEIVRQAAEREARILILHAGDGPMEQRTADALVHYQVDGCLISSATIGSPAAEICAENAVPVVMLNRLAERRSVAVACDNEAGGRDIAEFLVRGGHRRLGILVGPGGASTARDRERGFTSRLAELGLEAPLRVEVGAGCTGVTTYESGHEAGMRLAAMSPDIRPDAVMAISDIMAIGAIDALTQSGIGVPGEVSVVGFDGIPEGARPPYALTTIRQPIAAMVSRGFDLLAAVAAGSGFEKTVLLRGELIVGQSARR